MPSLRASLATALLVCLPAMQAVAVDLPRERDKWTTVRADEFVIFSSVSPRETTRITNELLRMRAALGKLTRLKVRSPLPTRVYVFRNEAAFAPFRDAIFGARLENIRGVFLSRPEGNFVLLQGDVDSRSHLIYHELTHYFVRNTTTGLPLWLDEGVAEYYSTFEASGNDVRVGRPVVEHVHLLNQQTMIPLARLFAIDQKSKEYNETSRQGIFYAQSWALVHYLFTGSEERRKQLPLFLTLVKQGKTLEQSFQTAFGLDFKAMESELRRYVQKRAFQYTAFSLEELPLPEIPAPVELKRDDLLYELGLILARSEGQQDDAAKFFTAALAANPRHAGANVELGALRYAAGLKPEAEALFERAMEAGSSDPDVYLSYGSSLIERIHTTHGGVEAPPKLVTRTREVFVKATELAPESARAWAGVGATYVVSADDPAAGIAALEKSLAIAPGQSDVAYNLVALYARAGRRDEAAGLIAKAIAPTGDPEMLRRAREAMAFADVNRAEELLQSGKVDEAATIYRSIAATTTEETLKAHATRRLQEIDSQSTMMKQAEAVNAAIDLAMKGKKKEALAAIDAVLLQMTDPELLRNTRKLREDLAKAKK